MLRKAQIVAYDGSVSDLSYVHGLDRNWGGVTGTTMIEEDDFMKRVALLLPVLMVFSGALAFGQLTAPGVNNTPEVGAPAPDFERPVGLRGEETLGLKDFAGRSKVLIAFYIADFTGG